MATQSRGATTAMSLKIDCHRVLFVRVQELPPLRSDKTNIAQRQRKRARHVQYPHLREDQQDKEIVATCHSTEEPHEKSCYRHRPSDYNDNVIQEDSQRQERHDKTVEAGPGAGQ